MPTRSLNVQITGDTRSLNRALSGAEGRMSKFTKGIGVAGAAAGGALALGLKKAVTAAADFEQQLDRLGAVSDASAKQMATLKKQALDAGAATKFSALEAAAAQTELAKGGLALEDILSGGLDAALGLAAAGEMDLAEAAEAAVNAMKLFNIDGRDATHVADALAQAANSTTADVSDFALALKQGGSAAKAAGYDLDQTVVALELLAENGIKGSDAGTSLKAMFAQLAAPTEKQLDLMDQLNIRFFDSRGNMKSVADISAMLRDRMSGMTKEQELQTVKTLAGTDGMRAMLSVYGAGPEKINRLSAELGKQGTAADVAAKKQDNLKGKWENFMGSIETLSIQVGTKLLPFLTDATDFATRFINSLQSGAGTAGRVSKAFGDVAEFGGKVAHAFQGGNEDATRFAQSVSRNVGRIIAWVRDLGRSIGRIFAGSGDDFRTLGRAFLRVERVAAEVVEAITKRTLPILKSGIMQIAGIVRGVVRVIAGILSGDFAKVWDGAKIVVRSTLRGMAGVIRGVGGILKDAMVWLAKAMIRALVSTLSSLAGAIKNAVVNGVRKGVAAASGAVSDIVGKINPFGDGIGRAARNIAGDGLGFLGGSAGGSGAGLMGADFDLGPFARIGASMGLRTTSGLRPGSVTSSGNTSYHSSGDAIDMSGPPGAMRRFFNTMKSNFGGRLRELIYTPGGAGIKDGRPFQYTGAVAADHYDHVHVAYTGPFGDGIGKGLGRFNSTSYGPPWGGINGGGVTATGVNLKGSPHRYGVAVDPSVIPLGTRLKIKPNPFGYGGYFTAFDTGGAIKGNRIDFYDWRGRSAQMNWGTRAVTVWTEDENPLGGGGGGSSRGPSARTRSAAAGARARVQARARGRAQARANAAAGSRPIGGEPGGRARGPYANLYGFAGALQDSLTIAGLTEGTGDDLEALTGLESIYSTIFDQAQKRGDLSGAAQAAGELKSVRDSIKQLRETDTAATDALREAIEANTRATEEHKAALDAVGVEMKRSNDIGAQVEATDGFQVKKMLYDVLSNQFGRESVGRSHTPGTGVEYAW